MNFAGRVISVACDPAHQFSKPQKNKIRLVKDMGIESDAHFGVTVQHRSRIAKTPDAPNLRQVHLIQSELFAELANDGFEVGPGRLGENITTAGMDLLALPRGARLRLGSQAVIEVTGLRNPCGQIDRNIGQGAMAAVLSMASDGSLIRRAGIMAIVVSGGAVRPGDRIVIEAWPEVLDPLEPV